MVGASGPSYHEACLPALSDECLRSTGFGPVLAPVRFWSGPSKISSIAGPCPVLAWKFPDRIFVVGPGLKISDQDRTILTIAA